MHEQIKTLSPCPLEHNPSTHARACMLACDAMILLLSLHPIFGIQKSYLAVSPPIPPPAPASSTNRTAPCTRRSCSNSRARRAQRSAAQHETHTHTFAHRTLGPPFQPNTPPSPIPDFPSLAPNPSKNEVRTEISFSRISCEKPPRIFRLYRGTINLGSNGQGFKKETIYCWVVYHVRMCRIMRGRKPCIWVGRERGEPSTYGPITNQPTPRCPREKRKRWGMVGLHMCPVLRVCVVCAWCCSSCSCTVHDPSLLPKVGLGRGERGGGGGAPGGMGGADKLSTLQLQDGSRRGALGPGETSRHLSKCTSARFIYLSPWVRSYDIVVSLPRLLIVQIVGPPLPSPPLPIVRVITVIARPPAGTFLKLGPSIAVPRE